MGAVLAKFRKEKSSVAVLEELDEQIKEIEKYSQNTQEQKKRFVGNFLVISIGVYVLAFLIFYFVYFPPTWKERILHSVPLFLFPLVIILLRRLFTWYFQRKLNKNFKKLTILRTEKKKILEQVMDKETYKVAVNLLARFGDKSNGTKSLFATPRLGQGSSSSSNASLLSINNLSTVNTSTTSSHQLQVTPNLPSPIKKSSQSSTPRHLGASALNQPRIIGAAGGGNSSSIPSHSLPISPSQGQTLRRRTPFPIVNKLDKSIFDRIVDVLIGDGPDDRFAMICKECFAHNGMALREEFDYSTFRCAFCNSMNPARKSRPIAPRLPGGQMGTPKAKDSSDSTSPDDEDSDTEHSSEDDRRRPFMSKASTTLTELKTVASKSDDLETNDDGLPDSEIVVGLKKLTNEEAEASEDHIANECDADMEVLQSPMSKLSNEFKKIM